MSVIRRRWLDEKGLKRAEYALHHRDQSPRFEGELAPALCPYCSHELAHSVELHEFAVHKARRSTLR